MIDPTIFKAYDIRGIYPDQIDEDGAYKIGRAFVDFLKIKEVAVGYDMRLSTPKLLPHLIQGINDAGAKVIDIGLTGTELMYFSVGHFGYESGIMMTASHNPAKYAGMKMVKAKSMPIAGDTGLMDICDLAINSNYQRTNLPKNIEKIDPFLEYKKKINEIYPIDKIKPFKVVVDAGNGMGGILVNKTFGGSALEIVPMYFEPDGSFPNHEANPIKDENTKELRKRVVEEKADLGIALDGDGDRCFFVNENGQISLGYYLVALIVEGMLKKYPNSKIIYENRNKWAIEDAIEKHGGIPVATPAGFAIMRPILMREEGAFGGETSSHFFYKDTYYADSSMATMAIVLGLMTDSGKKWSEILKPFRNKYFISGEINFKVDDANKVLEKIKKHYADIGLPIDELDGVAVDKDRDWRFSLRKSNTEPLVRLNVEGKSQEIVDVKTKEVETLIGFARAT